MKRMTYRTPRAGSLRRLTLVEEEIGPPADNEVTIAVKAIGLNFADVFTILGLYKAAPKRDCVPGIEFSGVVTARGKAVTGIPIGERVMGSIRFGGYTTHINIDHRYVLPIPPEWSFEEGASFIVQALTAYYALVPLGNVQRNQTVLIHSVAGGVGVYANRIAKHFGAYTIGTVGRTSKISVARAEGCDAVIVRGSDFPDRLRDALKGRPLDLVLDAVGGTIQRQSYRMLAPTGRLVAYGASMFASHIATPNYVMLAWHYFHMPRYQTLNLIESNKSLLGFNLIWLYDRVETWRSMLNAIQALHLQKPAVGARFPFSQLKEAVRTLQSGTTTGKVVVNV